MRKGSMLRFWFAVTSSAQAAAEWKEERAVQRHHQQPQRHLQEDEDEDQEEAEEENDADSVERTQHEEKDEKEQKEADSNSKVGRERQGGVEITGMTGRVRDVRRLVNVGFSLLKVVGGYDGTDDDGDGDSDSDSESNGGSDCGRGSDSGSGSDGGSGSESMLVPLPWAGMRMQVDNTRQPRNKQERQQPQLRRVYRYNESDGVIKVGGTIVIGL